MIPGSQLLHAERLPEIDAMEFEITPLQTSASGRVYRLRVEGANPRTGDILLVQKNQEPVAAFRVLKTEGAEIVAKRVRKYESKTQLELEQKYTAIHKLADLVEPPVEESGAPQTAPAIPPSAPSEGPAAPSPLEPEPESPPEPVAPAPPPAPPPAPTPAPDENVLPLMGDDASGSTLISKDQAAALDQYDDGIDHYDEGLDSTTTPRNLKTILGAPETQPLESRVGPGVIEHEPLSKFNQMLGFSVGSFRNMSGFQIPGNTNSGLSAYYNRVIEDSVWFEGHAPHDTLAIEMGLGYYSRANYTGISDNYEIMPIRGEFVYSLHVSPRFAFLTHVGAQFNLVFSAENAVDEGLSDLSGIQANAGVGMLYQIGPQWYVRGDAGLDRIAIGLAVKW